MDLFLESCQHNPNFRFIIFTETDLKKSIPDNVLNKKLSLEAFEQLASVKLGIECMVNNGIKICDYRPFYGKIFDDHITSEYWGHIDIDLILGDISKVLDSIKYRHYDVISFWKNHVAGPLSLFKNSNEINRLYELSPDWKKVVQSHKHFMFDECSRCVDPNVRLYDELGIGRNLSEFETDVQSITHVVVRAQNDLGIKYYAENHLKEFVHKRHMIGYNHGKMTLFDKFSSRNRADLVAFHFRLLKDDQPFRFPNWNQIPSRYYFDRTSFHNSRMPKFIFLIQYWILEWEKRIFRTS